MGAAHAPVARAPPPPRACVPALLGLAAADVMVRIVCGACGGGTGSRSPLKSQTPDGAPRPFSGLLLQDRTTQRDVGAVRGVTSHESRGMALPDRFAWRAGDDRDGPVSSLPHTAHSVMRLPCGTGDRQSCELLCIQGTYFLSPFFLHCTRPEVRTVVRLPLPATLAWSCAREWCKVPWFLATGTCIGAVRAISHDVAFVPSISETLRVR